MRANRDTTWSGLALTGLALACLSAVACSSAPPGSEQAVQDVASTSASSGSTTSAGSGPSCADGGPCEVGDSGPGGGIVFYVASEPFMSSAPCGSSCLYLEAQASDAGFVPYCVGPGATASIPNAAGSTIGAGYENTMSITVSAQCTSGAGFTAMAPSGGLTDWYLPALEEWYLLYQAQGVVGGLEGSYWTSTQDNTSQARVWNAAANNQNLTFPKTSILSVRAIRAF